MISLEDILWGNTGFDIPGNPDNEGPGEDEGGVAPAAIPVNCMTMCCATSCGGPGGTSCSLVCK